MKQIALLFSFCLVVVVTLGYIIVEGQWQRLSAQTLDCSGQFLVDQLLPTGARWQMCWEDRQKEGIVLYEVYYTPLNGAPRLVLATAHLAQIHVPYDDNGARYHDSTDSGLGGSYLTRLTTLDCPNGELRKTITGSSVLCLQVIPRGYAYRYTTAGNDTISQGYALNLFSISHVGEYNYIVQWQFADDGAILPSVGATGKLQRLGTYVTETQGWPLSTTEDGRIVRGVGHNHNYYWKLDFDIGDASNDLVEEFDFLPVNDNQERSLQVTPLTVESARPTDPELQRFWRIRDKVITNSDGHAISYEISPLHSGNRYIGPSYEPFTQNNFYVTRQKACEIFASHNPATGGCGENLAEYVSGENTDGQDLVVWFGLNFHHLPRDEDELYMPAHWDGFVIAPRDWTATNPLDANATPVTTPNSSVTPVSTPTPLPTASATSTPIPTNTATEIATDTPTPLPTATETVAPTLTQTAIGNGTQNGQPTQTETANATPTPTIAPLVLTTTSTHTPVPMRTVTTLPQATSTPERNIFLPLINR